MIEKLVYMSKEMSELALKICAILANKFKREIWENLEQVKILWTRQTNLINITSINSILKEYQDFTELFAEEVLKKTLSVY